MTQFARPISDITVGSWVPSSGTDLFSRLNEVVPSDVTEISYTYSFSQDSFEVKLGPVSDPTSSANHILSVRVQDAVLGDLNVELYQGSTPIFASLATGLVFTTVVLTLSAAAADSITDYTDLRVRVTGGTFANSGLSEVSWIELQVPNVATPPFYDIFLWARPDE